MILNYLEKFGEGKQGKIDIKGKIWKMSKPE
jgi:hypothetical protein